MLELHSVTKKFNRLAAVDRVSFSAGVNEIVGYLGPNGAGKSTTIKMLAGLMQPTDGDIFYKGCNIRSSLYDYKKELGYVPENSMIYPYLSAYEYLMLVGRLRKIKEKILKEKVRELLRLFHLADEMDFAISSYSKGMVQKVLFCSAILHDPNLLLLDEPLSGLDVATGLVIKELLQKLSLEGRIIIFSSHVLEVVEKICSRVLIIHEGRIIADDSVNNLRELMKLPSLEEIFSRLVVKEDTGAVADEIRSVMRYEG